MCQTLSLLLAYLTVTGIWIGMGVLSLQIDHYRRQRLLGLRFPFSDFPLWAMILFTLCGPCSLAITTYLLLKNTKPLDD